jgi:AcrR family transcriptional regulator
MAEVNRKLRARQTRARIAAAAARLFAHRGYQATPMDAIAAEADVAVQTVYFAFRTKPELLLAAYDQAVLGSLDAPPPDRQDWFLDVLAEQDPRQALRCLADGVMAILIRSGPLHPVMVTNPDEDIRQAFRHREQGRYESYRRVIHALMQHGGIQPGLDERTAADLLFALLSPELHNILCTTRGWHADDFKTWVTASLETQLLRPQQPQQRPEKRPGAAPA